MSKLILALSNEGQPLSKILSKLKIFFIIMFIRQIKFTFFTKAIVLPVDLHSVCHGPCLAPLFYYRNSLKLRFKDHNSLLLVSVHTATIFLIRSKKMGSVSWLLSRAQKVCSRPWLLKQWMSKVSHNNNIATWLYSFM